MFIATINTGTYDWVAVGQTEKQATEALLEAYRKHCAEYAQRPQEPQPVAALMFDLIHDGCVNVHNVVPGSVLRDGQPILHPVPPL